MSLWQEFAYKLTSALETIGQGRFDPTGAHMSSELHESFGTALKEILLRNLEGQAWKMAINAV